MFLTKKIDFECPNFKTFDGTVPSQCYTYQKNILQRLIFFGKKEACVNCTGCNATIYILILPDYTGFVYSRVSSTFFMDGPCMVVTKL